jgi:hypothetical protein
MSRIIARITGEGFVSTIAETSAKSVNFFGDFDIDADGANGQNGKLAAYRADGRGSEHLANGGMGIRNGRVVFTTSWGPDIAVADGNGNPLVNDDGVIVTKTAYRFPGRRFDDPAAYVDSETVPYVVVPPVIVRAVAGIVMGCLAFATYKGRRVAAMVGDKGPRTKTGEGSIELARRLGINPSPRTGGLSTPDVFFELFPGVPAMVDGVTYPLVPS